VEEVEQRELKKLQVPLLQRQRKAELVNTENTR
jgi:hypothetical protein